MNPDQQLTAPAGHPGFDGEPDLQDIRARKARLAKRLGGTTYKLTTIGYIALWILAVLAFVAPDENIGANVAYLAGGFGIACFMISQWYKRDLEALPVSGRSITGRLSGDALARLRRDRQLSPRAVWEALRGHWQAYFLLNHGFMSGKEITALLSDDPQAMKPVWGLAIMLADAAGRKQVEVGHVITALQISQPQLASMHTQLKLKTEDLQHIGEWLDRVLDLRDREQPYFGGIARDWANGFTPVLNRYGNDLSDAIEHGGGHFGSLAASKGVEAMQQSFAQGASAIALVGDSGIGKTSHVYALAQLLLEGRVVPTLQYHRIIGLNPSTIISSAKHPGELEQIVLTLLAESVQAGHIILFLDDAHLFFSNGPGSFDVTQILLPVMQSGRVRLVMAMASADYQRLKIHNAAFANLLSPVILSEPSQEQVMDVLEDTSLGMEHQHDLIITYEALREAYRLSGRYDSENAYPGKAIRMLEQSLSHAQHKVITALSVQQAIETTRGVKVSQANSMEANQLLHLEDAIHERMINQVRAVHVVSAALRRARAGVANPTRPIGSFLFLGPTGVGKTELAKAIAATYFGDEANMVRLDMSEYQRPDDVARLLSNGQTETNSLIMAVRKQPFSVVLLDEIEKAHPNILNLLLQMLDEGELTDSAGRPASFRDCVIICTSNAGADSIRQRIEAGQELESFEKELTDQLINAGQFKPELLNRFDEIVLFRPLKPEELAQVVRLMVNGINKTLAGQDITVELTDAAVMKIVEVGNDPRLGARPMRRQLQRAVEDGIANRILTGAAQTGDHLVLDVDDLAV